LHPAEPRSSRAAHCRSILEESMHFIQRLPAVAGAAALSLTFGAALAQSREKPSPAPALDAPTYQSVFDSYRPWRDETRADWRKANEEMGQLGGHAGQLRASPATPAASPAPARSGDGAHHENKEPRR
jgi:hypothetical protein